MAVEVIGTDGGLVTVRITGQLAQTELAAVQDEVARVIAATGSVRLLVVAEGFQGWERGAAWNDFSFQATHDANIVRMAIVAEARWRDLVLLFTAQGLRPFPIEFFTPDRRAEALAWLRS